MAKTIRIHIVLKSGGELVGPTLPCEDLTKTKSNMSDMLANAETIRITTADKFHHVVPVRSIDYATIEEMEHEN